MSQIFITLIYFSIFTVVRFGLDNLSIVYIVQLLLLSMSLIISNFFNNQFYEQNKNDCRKIYVTLFLWVSIFSFLDFIFKIGSSRFLILATVVSSSISFWLFNKYKNKFIQIFILMAILIGVIIYDQGQTLRDIDKLRLLDSRNVIVASSINEYFADQRPTVLPDIFNFELGGVWCGGAAGLHKSTLENSGYTAANLHFGFKEDGKLTHVVTLVKVGENWIISDAYFNLRWKQTLNEIAKDNSVLTNFSYVHEEFERRTAFNSLPAPTSASWTLGRKTKFPLQCNYNNDINFCLTKHDLEDFQARWGMESTYKELNQRGYPEQFQYLILFPYGLTVSGANYDVNNLQEVLNILKTT